MKSLFDDVSVKCSRLTTRAYSTSFSLGIHFLHNRLRDPIYSIYGFVRFADEIVDSFHGYNKKYLLKKFRSDTYDAIEHRISLNPVLNSFQNVVHRYNIDAIHFDDYFYPYRITGKEFGDAQSFKKYGNGIKRTR